MDKLRPIALLTIALLTAPQPARPASLSWAPVPSDDVAKALALNAPDDPTRYQRLSKMFELAGCKGEYLRELPVRHAQEPDLICTIPGVLTPEGAPDPQKIIVFSRYDHAGKGSGAIDNWTGAAMLPLLFATVFPGYREHTIQFVATFGPEGLPEFLKSLNPRQKSSIVALIDLRDLGMEKTRIAFLSEDSSADNVIADGRGTIRSGAPHTALTVDPPKRTMVGNSSGMVSQDARFAAMNATGAVSKLELPVAGDPYVEGFAGGKPQGVKHEAELIADSGIPGVVIHSITRNNAGVPGSAADSLDHIDQSNYYASYTWAAVYLLLLDHPLGASDKSH